MNAVKFKFVREERSDDFNRKTVEREVESRDSGNMGNTRGKPKV
jgi:hypothetical protein